jgi:hypothetical protein
MESLVQPTGPDAPKSKSKPSASSARATKLALAGLALVAVAALLAYQMGWIGPDTQAPKADPARQAEIDRLRALAEKEHQETIKRSEQIEKYKTTPPPPGTPVPVQAGG